MPFFIIRQDITKMAVDCIVTAGGARAVPNTSGGVNGRIHRKAGPRLLEAIARLGGIRTGGATITPAYDLPCKYVIHTAGPRWQDGIHGEPLLLRSCYREALALAHRRGLESIAFPLISSGTYGYPKEKAVQEASRAIREFLDGGAEMTVYLVVYDSEAFRVSSELFDRVEAFIDEHYVQERTAPQRLQHLRESCRKTLRSEETVCASAHRAPEPLPMRSAAPMTSPKPKARMAISELEQRLSQLDEGFGAHLERLMKARNMKPAECYKRANVDKKVYSKIHKTPGYTPKKTTAVAFAMALCLNMEETRDLLSRAGYSLSRASEFDVIVEFFISHAYYDVDRINQVLYDHDMPLLGSNAV